MSQIAALRLVRSLSGPEKRYFRLHIKKQSGPKDYLSLFNIINSTKTSDLSQLNEKFRKLHPNTSIDNSARYLIKLLTDCLIQSKTEKDLFFQSLQGLMRVRILQERSLAEEGYRQLKKLRRGAVDAQQHLIEYFTYRYELDYLSDLNFAGLSDRGLVNIQMEAKKSLRNLNHLQDHYSLFELLKYRIIRSGHIASEESKNELNDLILSEMALVANKANNNFTTQKLHLLFQSFFLMNIGDYPSALKSFHELNRLFEQGLHLLDNPPLDYLSSLNGTLDSLHITGNYESMPPFTEKVSWLDQAAYPEYFRYQARKTVALYQLAMLTGEGKFREAMDYIRSFEPSFLKAYELVDEERQWELYFYCSLTCFGNRDLKKAHIYIRDIMRDWKPRPQLVICRAIRLLDMIIYVEKRDTDYLEYEIRSYRRFSRQGKNSLQTERLVLKAVQLLSSGKGRKLMLDRKTLRGIQEIRQNKYEKRLLKYFDFTEWILQKSLPVKGEKS
jgi:hypothetical protein